MQIYFYAHTGHKVGLECFRRSVALIREFEAFDPILLTSDYRAASLARDYGIKRAIGVDVVRNIANVAKRGDVLIYDSNEHSEKLLEDMIDYFSTFIRFSDRQDEIPKKGEILISPYQKGENIIHGVIVDRRFFGDFNKRSDKLFFYGDDDYNKDLLKIAPELRGLCMDLLEGFYFFFGYQGELAPYFKAIYESETYEERLKESRIFVTSSFQSALEALASKSSPIYIQRPDKPAVYLPLLRKFNIPVLEEFDTALLEAAIEKAALRRDFLLNVQSVTEVFGYIKDKLNL